MKLYCATCGKDTERSERIITSDVFGNELDTFICDECGCFDHLDRAESLPNEDPD